MTDILSMYIGNIAIVTLGNSDEEILGLKHRCPLFGQWLCGKTASGLQRILCKVLVKRTQGKH